ncbi:SusD-like starch-binding protein associating with outer membrane [Arcticibacter tournemirensis]|uniref:RagB/SusD family nutrient uptake outer membrane protein n=2 Tax=Arcticibacter tournemirensis TaxID=699437 RepID=A0A5M9GPL3_9SPHI|nr:RagB/SusD family nutrient uptake outer membrane protein [Arcticibacter tournemirensis]TQM50772.1 SusD-like starch-binding protein associating with outer membrane [Arcticibacter tournemirensis]
MNMKYIKFLPQTLLCMAAAIAISLPACDSFLDEKPDKKLVVPSSLADLQAMLDNYNTMSSNTPASGEVSTDDYYLTDADWAARSETDRRKYLWEKDNLFPTGDNGNDWSYSYSSTFTCNTVLNLIGDMERNAANADVWDDIKGQALFFRGMNYLSAAFIWCMAYQEGSPDPGLPIRLDPDFNLPSLRSSLEETYAQVIKDARASLPLLPLKSVNALRPSKAAAYALLARTYLSMRRYPEAGLYADSCLQLSGTLLDFNTLNASASYPVKFLNAEVILERSGVATPLNPSRAKIDSSLYLLYRDGDLRKTVFFKRNSNGTYAFKGSFEGSQALFTGFAAGEMYLIRAEAAARQGDPQAAMASLNTLLAKRWNKNSFVPLSAAGSGEALQLILLERRKELVMRGLRWMDIKRLNREGAGISLQRKINGQLYTLPAGDPRFALPIPEDVIALSGMPQNPR